VLRIGAGVTQAAELWEMAVFDPCSAQGLRERLFIELWIAPRAGNRAHINQPFYVMRLQQFDERLERGGGMTDGEDFGRWLLAAFFHDWPCSQYRNELLWVAWNETAPLSFFGRGA